jgi:sugar phosphate isomerase/epimerase
MKLGVVGLLPPWEQITMEDARRVRRAGFRGASIFFDRPLEADRGAVKALKAALDAGELEVAQVNGAYEVLVHPDESLRAEGIRGMAALCRIGSLLETASVYVRPGSLNPRGAWYPHRDNLSGQVFDRLVDSLKQVCRTAADEGVLVAIEGHVLSPLDCASRVLQVIEAVGSPMLKFNIDAVNFIGTVQDALEPQRVINELFDLLGPHIAAAHLKDCALRDELVIHIDEVVLGEGTLDHELALRRLEQAAPGVYGIIEHLPDEKIPAAREGLLRAVRRAGTALED